MIYNFYYLPTQLFNFQGKCGNILYYWLLRQIKIIKCPRYFKTIYCSISYWARSINNYYILASLSFECLSFIFFMIVLLYVCLMYVWLCLRDRERGRKMLERSGQMQERSFGVSFEKQLFLYMFTCFLGAKLRVLSLQHGADSLTQYFKTANRIFGWSLIDECGFFYIKKKKQKWKNC